MSNQVRLLLWFRTCVPSIDITWKSLTGTNCYMYAWVRSLYNVRIEIQTNTVAFIWGSNTAIYGSYRKQGELIPGSLLFLFSSTKYSNIICSRLMNTTKVLLSPFHMINAVAYLLLFTQLDIVQKGFVWTN